MRKERRAVTDAGHGAAMLQRRAKLQWKSQTKNVLVTLERV